MIMRHTTMGAALAAALLIGTGSLPAGAQTDDRSDFAATDLNHDGLVNREEYHRRMMDVMLLADDDSDGMLTMDELPEVEPGQFRAADRNGDGMLSADEFMSSRFADFDEADQDGSGTLSPEEVGAYR
jgi:Ca2+-binding EF-hand superfamily protein